MEADEVHFSLCLNKILSEEAYIKKCLTGFPYKIIFSKILFQINLKVV